MSHRQPKRTRIVAQSVPPLTEIERANKAAAARFVHAFNDDDWGTVRRSSPAVHVPSSGRRDRRGRARGHGLDWAGLQGAVAGLVASDPDHDRRRRLRRRCSCQPPDSFSGQGEHAPPTGGRFDYGMVNMVRVEGGKLAEMWFGMDPLVEMQQLGVAPPPAPPASRRSAEANLAAFRRRTITIDADSSTTWLRSMMSSSLISPPQAQPADTATRGSRSTGSTTTIADTVYQHELITKPAVRRRPDSDRRRESRTSSSVLDHRCPGRSRRRVDPARWCVAARADPPDRDAGREPPTMAPTAPRAWLRHSGPRSRTSRSSDSLHRRATRHRGGALDCATGTGRGATTWACPGQANPSSTPVCPCTGSKTEGSPRSGTPATPWASCTSSTPHRRPATTTERADSAAGGDPCRRNNVDGKRDAAIGADRRGAGT